MRGRRIDPGEGEVFIYPDMARQRATFSLPSILAIVTAIVSFNVGAIPGLILAAIAFLLGVLGIVMAMSSRTRGGMLSILAIFLSFGGVIAAIVRAVGWAVGAG